MEDPKLTSNDEEILKDLKNDFTETQTQGAKPEAIVPDEVVPAFLPVPLIKLSVVGKNASIVIALSSRLPVESQKILKDAYKPTDEEIDLYRRVLESLIWKNFRHVAEWFMNNKGAAMYGELVLFETARMMPLLPLLNTEVKKEEEKK